MFSTNKLNKLNIIQKALPSKTTMPVLMGIKIDVYKCVNSRYTLYKTWITIRIRFRKTNKN